MQIVFEHFSKVIIVSNEYQFRFDKNFSDDKIWQKNRGSRDDFVRERQKINLSTEIKKPWQNISIWTDKKDMEESYWNTTKDFPVIFVVLIL